MRSDITAMQFLLKSCDIRKIIDLKVVRNDPVVLKFQVVYHPKTVHESHFNFVM